MAINQQDWNTVRNALGKSAEQLYRLVAREVTNEAGETTTVNSFEKVDANETASASFERIEADVERLIQEVGSLQVAERELRTALEEPGGAEMQRR